MSTQAVAPTTGAGIIEARKLRITVGYFLTFIALGLAMTWIGPTLPGLAARMHRTPGEMSYVFTAMAFGYLLGTFLGGRAYDRLPGHRVMAAALVVMAGTLALVPAVPLAYALAAILVVLGVAQGIVDVGGNTLLVWVHRRGVGPFMNGMHFFFGVGALIAPIVVAQAIGLTGDIAWACWALALLMVVPPVWVLRQPSPTGEHAAAEAQASDRPSYPLLFLMAAFFFTFVGAELSFGGWISTYTLGQGLGNEKIAAYAAAAFGGAMTLGRLVAVPVSLRVGPRTILFVDLVGCLASVAGILAWPSSVAALWAGTIGMGFFMASMFPTGINFAERRMAITGSITSWFLVGGSLGNMTIPLLIGQLIGPVGPRVVMIAIVADLALSLAIFAAILVRRAPSRAET